MESGRPEGRTGVGSVEGAGDEASARSHPAALEPEAATGSRRRSRRARVLAVSVAVALVGALGWFGLVRDPDRGRSALLGRAAPDLALRTLDGSETLRLSDLRGQVVVVNFWASWCDPCRIEHPAFLAAWERFRDQGVVFVGVLYQDEPSRGLAYQREVGGDWPLVADPDGRAALAFGVFGVPETYVIGPDGRVAFKQVGLTTYEVLTEQVTRLVAERSS